MEYRWKINLAGTLPDGHTPDLTITLLAIAGLKAKDIMGYCLMLLIVTGIIISAGLTWL